ncbi:hypothetical protein Pmani_025239 [Petrolisthes manimaculis]|uniref:Uncharacterized protein n=1 Tax=Petrolisthes manimaculis TaxID=1843537 RepID=A0AAE1P5X3_9EUCA|nr:hypothetical protein Pmani_025239 [Petrolisthes manimaculis]
MEQALTGVGHGGKKGQQGGAGIQGGGTGRQPANTDMLHYSHLARKQTTSLDKYLRCTGGLKHLNWNFSNA